MCGPPPGSSRLRLTLNFKLGLRLATFFEQFVDMVQRVQNHLSYLSKYTKLVHGRSGDSLDLRRVPNFLGHSFHLNCAEFSHRLLQGLISVF
jgi:hypothetical protein